MKVKSTRNSSLIRSIFSLLPLFCCQLIVSAAYAQPSGGPYGPVQKYYDLPDINGKIYFVAPDGKEENSGETVKKPTTLEKAISTVVTGDAIVMRGGTYRTGGLQLNQGIIIQPYQDEQPVIKGTFTAAEWDDLGNGLWKTRWTRLFPSEPDSWWRRDRNSKRTPIHRFNNDMVFVDGRFLQSAAWEGEVDENSYFINYETGDVFIGTDPSDRLVEITAFDVAINRTINPCHGKITDRKGPVIRGITFTQYAYRALEVEGLYPEGLSDEKDHGKDVMGTVLEHCEISYCSRVAAYLKGDSLIVRHCKVSDTSTEGLYIISSSDVLLEKNIFTRNNIEKITGYFPAAVKIFNQSYRVTCRDNLVIDHPYSNGIWYDVGNVDGVFVNNWIQGIGNAALPASTETQWPNRIGFFFEISKGVICAGNLFVNCDQGILILNSSDSEVYQNTLINSKASIGRTPRSAEGDHFGWHPSTGPGVDERDGHVFVNNLLYKDKSHSEPLLAIWQTPSLCDRLKKSPLKQFDGNLYILNGNNDTSLIDWSPVDGKDCRTTYHSLDALRKQNPEFESEGRFLKDYDGPLFRSMILGHFELVPESPGMEIGLNLPDQIRELLGYVRDIQPFAGAFQPNQQ